MPAPVLRHYRATGANNGVANGVVPAVPVNRALVGKIVVSNTHASAATTVTVYVGSNTAADYIVANLTLGPGETYIEPNVVVLAGEFVGFIPVAAGVISCAFFGEEVDN